jgi:endonuclease YncB( thermonuclease family)
VNRRRLARSAAALALAVPLALPAASSAQTTEEPCVPYEPAGLTCTFWTGEVARVDDGDTLDVRIDGEDPAVKVRITGIQAMELTEHSRQFRAGDCYAVEATQRLEQLVEESGGIVRLSAIDEASISRDRARRSVQVQRKGRWQDVGRILLREGLALWLPSRAEWAWNARYSTYAERAAAERLGLWNPQACGYGPSEGHAIEVLVNGDGDRIDSDDLAGPHGEWVRVTNLDPAAPLDLSGWWLRDSDLRQFTFPGGTVLAPGTSVTVHVGDGVDTLTDLFWGLGGAVFDNVERARELGDGAYLFDPDSDLRAWMTYPCRTTCADPAAGALEVVVDPLGRETVGVRNIGTAPVDLGRYVLSATSHRYAFAPGTWLAPGETLRVVARRSPTLDEPLLKGWGKRSTILSNSGGAVRLSSHRGAVLACAAWGDGVC